MFRRWLIVAAVAFLLAFANLGWQEEIRYERQKRISDRYTMLMGTCLRQYSSDYCNAQIAKEERLSRQPHTAIFWTALGLLVLSPISRFIYRGTWFK
jgi:hypothetical protein